MMIKSIKFIITIIFYCLALNVVSSQCAIDDVNVKLTAMNFDVECIAVNETTTIGINWVMEAFDGLGTIPAGSFQIQISMDAQQPPRYSAVNGVADIDGPGFDWTWDQANNTFEGVNNTSLTYDITDIFNAQTVDGIITVTVTGLINTDCIKTISNATIEIPNENNGGCPDAFENQISDDEESSSLGVSPRYSLSGLAFHDNFADGTQDNNAGDGTGTDAPIGGVLVTLNDCGTNGVCGDTDDGPSQTTNTLADGTYMFDGLAPSNYQVEFGNSDGVTTYDEFTTMDTGTDETVDSDVSSGASGGTTDIISVSSLNPNPENIDAGLFQYASISGTLYNDNDGTNGTMPATNTSDVIIVTYCNNPTTCDQTSDVNYPVTTDVNGNYVIDNLIPGVILAINATTYSTFEEASVVNEQSLDAHSGGSIEDQNFALPVELVYFQVSKVKQTGLIEWQTSSEVNNDYFEVEVSTDGDRFDLLGKVKGAGTTTAKTNYSLIQYIPHQGKNYYRLKQVDLDGQFSYSEIRVLDFDRTGSTELSLLVYPVPTHDMLSIAANLNLDNHKIVLYDNLGRKAIEFAFNREANISLTSLQSGVFQLVLLDENGNLVERKSIIKID